MSTPNSIWTVLLSVPLCLETIDGEVGTTSAAEYALGDLTEAVTTLDPSAAVWIHALVDSVVSCEDTWLAQITLIRRAVERWLRA
jgi:hypothetical protein